MLFWYSSLLKSYISRKIKPVELFVSLLSYGLFRKRNVSFLPSLQNNGLFRKTNRMCFLCPYRIVAFFERTAPFFFRSHQSFGFYSEEQTGCCFYRPYLIALAFFFRKTCIFFFISSFFERFFGYKCFFSPPHLCMQPSVYYIACFLYQVCMK